MLKLQMEGYFGWNLYTSNNIETAMILGHIENLKSYISTENLEYLKSIDLTDPSKTISKSDAEKISSIIKQAENARESQTQANGYER